MRSAIRFFVMGACMLPLCFSSIIYSQTPANKSINEICEGDGECASGHCVTAKDEDGQTRRKCCDCDQSTLDSYTRKKEEACENKEKGMLAYADLRNEFGSKNELSLVTLNLRRETCLACLTARLDRENACWKGGDQAHRDEIQKMKDALNYIDGIIDEKKRNKLAYYCDEYTYNNTMEDITDNCKDLKSLFEKYGTGYNTDVYCSDIYNVVDKCIDCREAYEHLAYYCYRDGLPEKYAKELKEVQDMEKISKETYDKKKNDGTCK